MSFKNRGLGRGLEALLVDVSANEDKTSALKIAPPDKKIDQAAAINEVADLAEVTIREERQAILAEALVLKELMCEIEQQVRGF